MAGYCYKHGFKPYNRNLSELTPRVRQILAMLEKEKGWGRLNRIARRVGVSRCFVWQVAHRLEKTLEQERKELGEILRRERYSKSQPCPVGEPAG